MDPANPGTIVVNDLGGNDIIRVLNTPERDASQFIITGTELIWRSYLGGEVRFRLGASDAGMIETFQWEVTPGVPSSRLNLDIVTSPEPINSVNVAYAGTIGDDVIAASNASNGGNGWTDIYGNAGNDTLTGSSRHAAYLYGGTGNDTLQGSGEFGDYFYGDSGNDWVYGGGGSDGLYGGSGTDTVSGGTGSDDLHGEDGNDRLLGGTGADTLTGGRGRDSLAGNAGFDEFVFTTLADSLISSRDEITGFTRGEDDIVLTGIDAQNGIPGNQAFTLDTDGAFSRGEIRQVISGGNLILQMNVDTDTDVEMAILLLGVSSRLASTDFAL